jgi:diadenosine tetraphosphate (Ap4A) HIT family hydrolase
VSTTRPARTCPFCNPLPQRILIDGISALALWDSYPLNPGHVLVVPRRHIASWFDATGAEHEEILRLADAARRLVIERHAPDAFNLGINDGPAAGQTVPHLHLHLIPRYAGDVRDPRGGVRWIIPDRAVYWKDP